MSQLSAHASLTTGQGGLAKIVVDHPSAAGEIYLHGAHVTHWQPAGQKPVLYLSPAAKFAPGKAIRGGIPICLPWFGPLAGASDAPAHGLVRTREWSLAGVEEDADGVTARLRIDVAASESPHWPDAFSAELAVTFGATLSLWLTVTNTGETAFSFEEALHSYYHVGDARVAAVEGLHNVSYLDKPAGGSPRLQSAAAITFGDEVDRVYVDTDNACVIHDPVLGRKITVEKALSHSTVIWNPAERRAGELADLGAANWPNFVCVETANIGDDAVKLAPGLSHEMILVVRVGDIV